MALLVQTGQVSDFTASINTGWYDITFKTPFASGVVPVVFAQIQTRNGKDTPGLRLRNVSNTGFQVRMDEVIQNNTTSSKIGDLGEINGNGDHPHAETLGWMAIQLG